MDPNQERVWFAREVMNLFVKAFTNLKLYPHEHKHVKSALEDFGKRLRSFVQMYSVLRIKITQETMTVEEQAVYEAESRNENLAFRLYVDGLREISIAQGVTMEEAFKLAHVFYQAIVDTDSDSTLLMWEADFRNIDHVAINSLTDAWESPDFFSADQLDVLKQMNRDVNSIVESLTANAGRGTFSFELTDGANEMETADRIDDDSTEREDDEGIFEVDDAALAHFRDEVLTWGPDRLLGALVDSALDGLALMPEVIGRDMVQWLTVESVSMSLRSRDMELLSNLLDRFAGEKNLLEEDDPSYGAFQAPIDYMARTENVERLLIMVKGGDSLGGPKAYTRLLSHMGKPGMLTAASTYRVAESKELKDALVEFMKDHVQDDPRALQLLVKDDMAPETVKTALFVANNRVKGPELTAILEVARKHPDPKIQEYATHLWRTNTDAGRVKITVDALRSDVRADRVKALQAIVRSNHTEAVDVLREIISAGDFLHKDSHERKAFIDAYRYLGGTRAVGFLEEQSKRATRLFNRKAAAEVRDFAIKALEDLKKKR
ncbi:MAG: hypothetical protein AB7N76_03465 [Planctomycetota bacterium]